MSETAIVYKKGFGPMDGDGAVSGYVERPTRAEEIAREAAFLVERLEELNWTGDDIETLYRDYAGHCDPSVARLKAMLFAPEDMADRIEQATGTRP